MLRSWYPVAFHGLALISYYPWQRNREQCRQPWVCVLWRTQQGFCISGGHMVREVRRSLNARKVRVWKWSASQAAQALPVPPFWGMLWLYNICCHALWISKAALNTQTADRQTDDKRKKKGDSIMSKWTRRGEERKRKASLFTESFQHIQLTLL